MISGRDFIIFGLQPWDIEIGSNCKDIATEIAKNNRVLYINRPIERATLYKFRQDSKIQTRLKSLKQGIGVLEEIKSDLWIFNPRVILESINFLSPGFLYNRINKINAKRLSSQIQWAVDKLNFKDPILFIDNDFLKGLYLNDYLKTDKFVYYIRDYLRSQKYFEKHGATMEPAIIKKADIIVTNSLYLSNYAKQFNPRSFDIGQGCELDGYLQDNYVKPDDLKKITGPIIGYCGSLVETRLDISLLEKIAKQKPEWNIVLVGPEDEAFKNSFLHSMHNVFFTGSRPATSLPAYVHNFDVCINPQVLNQMTIGNYPRKIDEYLAAGKPVVATETEAMEMFKDYCILAKDLNGYIKGISESLSKEYNSQDQKRRRDFALSHTWEASVNAMYCKLQSAI